MGGDSGDRGRGGRVGGGGRRDRGRGGRVGGEIGRVGGEIGEGRESGRRLRR